MLIKLHYNKTSINKIKYILKTLVYIPVGLNSPELEILLSKCQKILDEKKELIIVKCLGQTGYTCSKNIFSQKNICAICKNLTDKGISKLSGKFTVLTTPKILNENNLKNKFFSKGNIKKLYYKKFDIGASIYSSYIGLSRDHELDGYLSQNSLNNLLKTSKTIYDFFEKYLNKNKVKKIILYNGRHNQYRPLLRVAQKRKIETEIMEYSGDGKNENGVRSFFNNLPTDINYLYKLIIENWKNSKKKNNCDYYFRYKRQGKIVHDKKSYIYKQNPLELPKNWKKEDINIVFFTSSQDEYAALGGEYDNTIYKDQTDAIIKISNFVKKYKKKNKKIVLWVRCHPNLENVFWKYNKSINFLHEPEKNINIIEPNSTISSYMLMRECNKVITYNSLTGIEAVYWKKPSIVLGRRVYEKLDCVYTPKNHIHNTQLILKEQLKPKKLIGSLKFASFWVEGGYKIKYLKGNLKIGYKFKNSPIRISYFEKIIYLFEKFKQYCVYNYLISYKLFGKK